MPVYSASAIMEWLIKLLSNLPTETSVEESFDHRHYQPSASTMLMSQPICPKRPVGQAEPEQARFTKQKQCSDMMKYVCIDQNTQAFLIAD